MNEQQFLSKWGQASSPRASGGLYELYAKENAKKNAPRTAKQRNLGTSLLPAGGAILAGLAAAPFTGGLSLPAAIALAAGAGAVGSGVGEYAAQKANKEEDNEESFIRILKEGAIGGLFGGGGAVIQGARGAHAAHAAGMTWKAARNAAAPVASGTQSVKGLKEALTLTAAQDGSKAATAKLAGKVATSTRSKGIGAMDLRDELRAVPNAAKRVATADAYKIPAGEKGLKQATVQMAKFEDDLGRLIGKKTIPANQVAKELDDLSKVSASALTDPAQARLFNKHIADIRALSSKGKVNLLELRDLRSNIGNGIFKGQITPKKEIEQEIYRKLGDVIGKHSKEARSVISEQHRVLDLGPGLAARSEQLSVPWMGTRVKAPLLAGVRDRLIDATTKVQGMGPASTGLVAQTARQTGRQAIPRTLVGALGALGGGESAADRYNADPTNPEFLGVDPAEFGYSEDPTVQGGQIPGDPQQAPPQSLYSLEQALSDIQRDPKNAARYESTYKMVQASEKAKGGGGMNVTKPTQEDYTNAVTGAQALQQLSSLIASDPGVLQRTRVPGRGINVLGIGSEIQKRTDTGAFDTLGFQAVENLLRIQTGAAAPEQEVRRYMNKYLPQPSDNKKQSALKIQRMNAFYQSVLQQAQGGTTPEPYYGQGGYQ